MLCDKQGNCTSGGLLQVNIPPEGTCFPQHAKEAGSMLINCEHFGFPLDLGILDMKEVSGLCYPSTNARARAGAIVKGQMSKICADCIKTQVSMNSVRQKSNHWSVKVMEKLNSELFLLAWQFAKINSNSDLFNVEYCAFLGFFF